MTSGAPRTAARRAAVLGVLVLLMQLVAGPAWAHSELERSDPPNGGMVAVGRSYLTFWFGEEVNLDASTFELRSQDGTRIDLTASIDGGSGGIVRLDTEPLALATYELDWRVLSLVDGHPASGSVLFGVGTRPDVVPTQGSALPGLPLLVLRWLDLLALMLMIGSIAVSDRVLGALGELGSGPRRRVRRIALAAAVAAFYAGLLTPFIRTMRPGNPLGPWISETWSTLVGSPWGHLWLVREAVLLVAALAIWSWARRPAEAAPRLRVAIVALALTSFVEAWAGHASGLPVGSFPAAVLAAAHVLAAGVWAGGLVVLAVSVVPVMRREPRRRRTILASVFRTFSPIAAAASVVLVATGLYEAGRHLPDLSSATSTVYGAAVVLKLALVLGALALAAIHTLLVHPRLAARVRAIVRRGPGWSPVPVARFSATVTTEAALLMAALVAAAMLTSVPTAREVGDATALTAPHSENVDGLFVTFEEVPGGPGLSRLLVRVRSTVMPPPAPVRAVEVALTAPDGTADVLRLRRTEEGRYEAETPKATPGPWSAAVNVRRSGRPDAVAHASWVQSSPTQGGGPLEMTTTGLAALLLAGLGVALLAVRRRARHSADASAGPTVGPTVGPNVDSPAGPTSDRMRQLEETRR